MKKTKDTGVDPLPSWSATRTVMVDNFPVEQPGAKVAIMQFVRDVTTDGDYFVEEEDRIAVFDNDGTLWSEQSEYFPVAFINDRVDGMAAADILAMQDLETGETTEEYGQAVLDWLEVARHPEKGLLYKDMIFQPMLELLEYLRAHGFKTHIISGGGIEFMRPWTESAYGIPPEQVMGSCVKTTFTQRADGSYALVRQPLTLTEQEKTDLGSVDDPEAFLEERLRENFFVDDNVGKPVGINLHLGRAPIAAFGNSSGDQQMLEWTTRDHNPSEGRLRFGLLVDHTDGEREWDYSDDSAGSTVNPDVGHLHDETRTLAAEKGWTIVDMVEDWLTVYPPQPEVCPEG